MDNILENRVIQFKNITRKKEGLFANFLLKSERNGVVISANISVDISALDLSASDTTETIALSCAKHALKTLQKETFSLEPTNADLGVAQLG
jgi:hypothetical protein